jgi:hypothetical protein
MAGGRTNEADVQPFVFHTAVTYPGTVLKIGTTAGEVDLCGAGEEPCGYSFGTTKHPITGVAGAAVTRGVVALINGQEAELLLSPTNAVIAVGDDIETAALGTVDLLAVGGWVLGKALEARAALVGVTAGTYVRVRIDKHWVAP